MNHDDTIRALRRALVEKEREAARLSDEVAHLRKAQVARSVPTTPSDKPPSTVLIATDDAALLQEVGIYEYHHPLENAEKYEASLAEVQAQMRALVIAGQAVEASRDFTFNNSVAQGKRLVADLSKLMLRAFNSEADSCVRTVRAGNSVTSTKRLNKAASDIEKLGRAMEIRIAPEYLALREAEIELTADYLTKKREEREEQREERARLREEEKVAQELRQERSRLDKEFAHYKNILARAGLDEDVRQSALAEYERIERAISRNEYRTANIRAGYVYVISNVGAFGDGIVKIGLTRRLDPMERVRELSSASVPFPFDVHAIYFSDDAVSLENSLHKEFASHKVNQVNTRREFFFATPEEVKKALTLRVGGLLEFTTKPEATEYYQSRHYW